VVRITIDGREIDAPEGAPLVEVIKQNGIFVPHLCYLDGLEPYAGCRTCVVEIEGVPGLPLSCTAKVTEGMVVRTNTPEVKAMRKAVVGIINANHSDRCLTCHRRVKCMPGDTCLRDDIVTHRCVTCSKNYRCELQTTNELAGMANYEPFLGEARTYYQAEQPEPDRANPFFEFDPQMCIICTRCVRTCDDVRHTRAITLAGRGDTTRIAFGSGGPIHDSSCDFCGSCIDACPTAALMEQPNKWIARTDEWVSTTCNSCSVGCTISLGIRNGMPVIVRPDPPNPVSFDQICVRGRFHYDAIKDRERLSSPMLRSNGAVELGGALRPASWEEALDTAADRLVRIREEHGPGAIAFLGSPILTNEENYLVQKLAREVIGSGNVDFAAGAVHRAIAEGLRGAFGGEALPADMTRIAAASTVVVIADDLESSHNVAALRIKDAVVRNGARLVVVSPRYGEVCDFASAPGGWLRPRPGGEAQAVQALASAVAARPDTPEPPGVYGVETLKSAMDDAAGLDEEALEQAAALLSKAAADQEGHTAIVFAPNPFGTFAAGETAKAAANLALVCCGAQEAAQSLHVLPTEANVTGARDVGLAPDLLPGLRPAEGDARGLSFGEMLSAIEKGRVRALVVAGDNPFLWAPNRTLVEQCLAKLEFLLVIDSLPTETAQRAHVILPDVPTYAKDGTYTSADRRLLLLKAAISPRGEARPAWRSLSEVGRRLAERLSIKGARFDYESPVEIMAEISSLVSAYRETTAHGATPMGLGFLPGKTRVLFEAPSQGTIQAVAPFKAPARKGLVLTTGRSLYTSLEGASIRSPEADKLHREEFVEINPADAADLRIGAGDEVVLVNGKAELPIKAVITEAVAPGTIYVPLYYDGGAVTALLPSDDGKPLLPRVKVAVRTPA
jgi:predicted molibdopterin-dependent oxidoreductase YjgC